MVSTHVKSGISVKDTTSVSRTQLINEIRQLAIKKNAIILVHNYQRSEIYKVADFIGDSLDLAKKAVDSKASIIVFCGVDFMAETAKILSPEKMVLLPVASASCPMAAMINEAELETIKAQHPEAAVVTYVNSNASIKALSDKPGITANR